MYISPPSTHLTCAHVCHTLTSYPHSYPSICFPLPFLPSTPPIIHASLCHNYLLYCPMLYLPHFHAYCPVSPSTRLPCSSFDKSPSQSPSYITTDISLLIFLWKVVQNSSTYSIQYVIIQNPSLAWPSQPTYIIFISSLAAMACMHLWPVGIAGGSVGNLWGSGWSSVQTTNTYLLSWKPSDVVNPPSLLNKQSTTYEFSMVSPKPISWLFILLSNNVKLRGTEGLSLYMAPMSPELVQNKPGMNSGRDWTTHPLLE